MDDIDLKDFLPLKGRKIVVASSGSVSVYRMPDLVRDLRREGADVWVAMSQGASRLVSPELMKWASGHNVAVEITGDIEHISLIEDREDVLLIVPATYNTIGKMSSGIADSIVTALFSHALGNGNRIIAVPVMHLSMYSNPIMQRNLQMLREMGVRIIDPIEAQGKAKIPLSATIVDEAVRASASAVSGRNALVITGKGHAELDPVRLITNRSSGETGYWLARSLYRAGFSVTVLGSVPRELPGQIKHIPAGDVGEFFDRTRSLLRESYSVVTLPAAIPDFAPERSAGKIDSTSSFEMKLNPVPKLVDEIRKHHKGLLVPFRLTSESADDTFRHFKTSRPDAVVLNYYDTEGGPFGDGKCRFIFLTPDGKKTIIGINKEEACTSIAKEIAEMVK